MSWVKDIVFTNADDFLKWLDSEFGDYIEKHINQNHVHHTWAPSHKHYPKYTTLRLHKNMRSFHVTANGWSDIAQNITIGKDGDIVTGRDIQMVPVSATGHNGTKELHPFAYEMIGNFDKGNDKFEGKQLESAIKISRYFYKKGKAIKFHRELLLPNGKVPKTCPGTGIEKDWFMDLVKDDNYDSPKKATPKPIEQPTTPSNMYRVRKSWNDAKSQIGAYKELENAIDLANKNVGYEVYDSEGKQVCPTTNQNKVDETPKEETKKSAAPKYPNILFKVQSPLIHNDHVKKIQQQLNKEAGKQVTKVDGYYGKDTKKEIEIFQGKNGLKKDGVVGKLTWNALFK